MKSVYCESLSYLEPDTVNGMKYLEAVREVFGPAPQSRRSQ